MPDPPSPLRDARRLAGLSQRALADATGLSRQTVSAIEAGRHRPSVDAAIALGRVLGISVEALFAAPTSDSLPVTDADPADGAPIVSARVGGRPVHAPAADGAPWWPASDGSLIGGRVALFPGGERDGVVVVGCDPALGVLAGLLPSTGPRRLVAIGGSTRTAIAALDGGRAHAAVVHGVRGSLPDAAPGTQRIHLARWQVGLAFAADAPAPSLGALAEGRTRVVQRDPGATSQQALTRALRDHGPARLTGPTARGHLDVARRVVDGEPTGVTIAPAARHHRLGFTPLEEHDVEIWVADPFRDHPGVVALGDAVGSRALRARLRAIGAYDLTDSGTRRNEDR